MLNAIQQDQEIERCFSIIRELRPLLDGRRFLRTVRTMEQEGFRLAFLEQGDELVTVAGYRIYTNMFMGKNLFVDDLVTADKYRSHGYGEKMLAWLRSVALENDCQVFHLDSGTQRHQARKFDFCQGLIITDYHFCGEAQWRPGILIVAREGGPEVLVLPSGPSPKVTL